VKNLERSRRQSGIELLKLIAIILVVLSHSVPFYGDPSATGYVDLNSATDNLWDFILIVLRYMGQLGNVLFVVSSAYFLVDKNKVKVEKILQIVSDSLFISVAIMIGFILSGCELGPKIIIKQIFPITFQNMWFVGCYLILYSVSPFLNKIIHNTHQKTLLRLIICMLVLYSGVSFLLNGAYYYSFLVGFIMIYFIVAYMKKYMQKFGDNERNNTVLLAVSVMGLFVMLLGTNFLGLRIHALTNQMLRWNIFTNPFIIGIGVALFNLFKNIDLRSKIINYLASLTLIIYMIHENYLIREYIKPLYFNTVKGNIVAWSFVLAICTIPICILMGIIYKEIFQKLIGKYIIPTVCKRLKVLGDLIEDTLLRIE
jgi:surface polysaccharide O-acyltransferase-like enzyme